MKQLSLSLFPFDEQSSYVYFFQAGEFIKIGYSTGLKQRASDIQVSNPFDLKLVKFFKFDDVNDAIQAESDFHYYFRERHIRGEWFAISPDDIPEFIPRRVDGLLLAMMYSLAYCVVRAKVFLNIASQLAKLGCEVNPYLAAMNRALVDHSLYDDDYWGQVRLYNPDNITIDDVNRALKELNGKG